PRGLLRPVAKTVTLAGVAAWALGVLADRAASRPRPTRPTRVMLATSANTRTRRGSVRNIFRLLCVWVLLWQTSSTAARLVMRDHRKIGQLSRASATWRSRSMSSTTHRRQPLIVVPPSLLSRGHARSLLGSVVTAQGRSPTHESAQCRTVAPCRPTQFTHALPHALRGAR